MNIRRCSESGISRNMNPRYLGMFIIFIIYILTSTTLHSWTGEMNRLKIMIITGGHEFDPSFFKIFDSYPDVGYDTLSQPGFNNRLKEDSFDNYDALVFYDMWQEISGQEKKAFMRLLDGGMGILFLHHALVSYQHWDEFKQIIGGKYLEAEYYDDPDLKGSDYKEDITLDIKIVNKNHPVTKEVSDFSIYDEGYQDIEVITGIEPLLSTSHPHCTPVVGWAHRYRNSQIVYFLLGHGPQAYLNEQYRKLIHNAIKWVAGARFSLPQQY